MDEQHTKSVHSQTLPLYRCTCGNDVPIDLETGGQCAECQRVIPASVTRDQLSMTMTVARVGDNLTVAERQSLGEDELIGKRLGHFQIIEPIGHGGMGQVYRALDTSLQRFVAVKVLRGSESRQLNSEDEQKLLREAVAQARVNHPNIVTIYFVGGEGETPFLAMELIDGHDVAELIRRGPLPYDQLSYLAIKITHALDTASAMGIVHADIKPQNLLLLGNGEVKLSDFGMARHTDDDTAPQGGTPNYLAPELLEGNHPTIQSDMYALGVTLYEMTFQRLPVVLSGSTVKQWSAAHAKSKITFPDPWPDHLPTGWRDILKRLLARRPEQRFESYQQLGQALLEILPTQQPSARPIPRVIAFFIDLLSVMLIIVPLQIVVTSLRSLGGLRQWNEFIESAIFLAAITIYSVIIYAWRQSLGRELLHVKILNQYGLEPSRRIMLVRSGLRMIVIWALVIGFLLESANSLVLPIIVGGACLFTLVDFAAMLFRRGHSIHDQILKTRAVVGAETR